MQAHDNATDPVLVGEVTAPFGIRGEVKMFPLMRRPEQLASLPAVRLQLPDGSERLLKVAAVLAHQGVVRVRFEGIDRNDAEGLRGARVLIRRADFPPLPDGEYYEWQLLGMQVVSEAGESLGTVERVLYNPVANDVWETESALIPAVDAFVVSVDVGQGRIVVRDEPGLRK